MADDQGGFSNAANAALESDGVGFRSRDRSTIEFPYVSLEVAEEVALAVYRRCGHGSCEIDELSAEMGQAVSGNFRQKTAAAKTFGVLEKDGRSAFTLSDIGRKIVSENSSADGRVEAFLAVPLYSAIFEKYRGHNLPPPKALEREMESLGVAAKQTDKARQAFERSAQHAGFFGDGRGRLVRPRNSSGPDRPVPKPNARVDVGPSGGSYEPPAIDPIIQGLLARLPRSGAEWSEDERDLWLDLLRGSFKLIYRDVNSVKES